MRSWRRELWKLVDSTKSSRPRREGWSVWSWNSPVPSGQVGDLREQMVAQASSLATKEEEAGRLSADLEDIRDQLHSQEEKVREVTSLLSATRQDYLEVSSILKSVMQSTSWRVTQPLRWLAAKGRLLLTLPILRSGSLGPGWRAGANRLFRSRSTTSLAIPTWQRPASTHWSTICGTGRRMVGRARRQPGVCPLRGPRVCGAERALRCRLLPAHASRGERKGFGSFGTFSGGRRVGGKTTESRLRPGLLPQAIPRRDG